MGGEAESADAGSKTEGGARASSRSSTAKRALGHLALFLALTLYTLIGGIIFRELEYHNEVSTLGRLEARVHTGRHRLLTNLGLLYDPDLREHPLLAILERELANYQVSRKESSGNVFGEYGNGTRTADPGGPEEDRGPQLLTSVASQYNNTAHHSVLPLIEMELATYEAVVQEAASRGVLVAMAERTNTHRLAKWNHIQAVFFASTVLTTIGYGNLAPETVGGRCFCIVFAVVGIPLALTVIADVGMLLAASLPAGLLGGGGGGAASRLGRLFVSRPGLRSLMTALGALLLLVLFLSLGALIFLFVEDDWRFFDAFYFCFITTTTIGFGDLVPEEPQYMLLCTAYILVGLSLTSTIIELVRLEYLKSWRRLQAVADALRRLAEAGAGAHAEDDLRVLRADLKNMLSAIASTSSGDRHGRSDWHKAIAEIVDDIGTADRQPRIVQVIVYETSV